MSAVPKEKVDQVLAGHSQFSSQFPEVSKGHDVEANRHLSCELAGSGVFSGFGKIVFSSHGRLRHISTYGGVHVTWRTEAIIG